MARRLLSIWFPRLASEAALRASPVEGAFALIQRSGNADHVQCLNLAAERAGLHRGMALADARAICPQLVTRPAEGIAKVQEILRRWAVRYAPHVAVDGPDGLIADITGAAHLFGGEEALRLDLHMRLDRAGFTSRSAIAGTRGAAHALARHGGTISDLPVAALRIEPIMAEGLGRLGLKRVGDLLALPRAPLIQRFGPELALRLDQLLGRQPEPVAAPAAAPRFAVRMALADPIGLHADVMAGLTRLLDRLCATLSRHQMGARRLRLELRRVDRATIPVEIGLAQPLRDPDRIARLFAPKLETVDAGFGIDALRLVATLAEPLAPAQMGSSPSQEDAMADLITRLGNRLGFHNILRIEPTDSLLPERSFRLVPATEAKPGPLPPGLPAVIFPPERVGGAPPDSFQWRGEKFESYRATGPQRIAPDWWEEDPAWASGLRDYWRVQTRQGPRLWLFHTPQAPAWYVQGQFA
ncbi:Y-family DNA polymerase [Paracoccus sp. NGMCC 1.201697]|uniref:DNA-directed DNA polymerase n=1 Tax=Paracoccus broussonetiae subsp. drimophilus TaxID=3373869 RepID=A0ABW7LRR3_9RHOB